MRQTLLCKWGTCAVLIFAGILTPFIEAAPSINTPTVSPATLTVNQSTLVTTSCQINTAPDDPPLIAGGVNLVRLTATGTPVSVIGIMHDDGLNGDAKAGDRIYTLQFTADEPAAGQFELECTAAFKGILERVKSPAVTVTVNPGTGSGSISPLTIAPKTIPFGTATEVTITTAVTGGTPDSGSVMLQRLDSSGRVLAILGTFHDDGLNDDVKANDGIFTLQNTFNEFEVGPISLRASATFSGAVNHVFSPIATLTVTGTPPPTVTISSPVSLGYLNLSPTTVSGKVGDPKATVAINSIPAPVDGNGNFSASVPLQEGPNILAATAKSASGAVGSSSITVTLDTTPPHVTITSPGDKFVTTSASISVAGNVNDIVVGTVNSQQAKVTVNGIASQVANRTFLATNIPLSMGSNTVQAVAVDRAGNSEPTQITVIRQAPQPGQIQLTSGNNQTGTIRTALSAPLVVELTDSSGHPAANKPVIFTVTQNNGMLSTAGGKVAPSVIATTDTQGHATATWTLGKRSGAGSDGAQAYSVGFGATAVFTATAKQGPPGLIVIDSGNNQTGAVNQPLPEPLITVVVDAGHNRLAGVPVTFSVAQGGGSFAGQPSLTVTTDSDGRAAATLTLGFQEGSSNNLVTANFSGNTGFPASFTASGLGPGDPAKTVISGLVLDNTDQPIPGVTVHAVLTNALNASVNSAQTAPATQTDAKGRFSLYKAPVGFMKLLVDGSTATAPGTFPTLEYDMVTVPGQINTLDEPVFLLPIKTNNKLCVTASTGGGTLTIPEAPGFSLTFGPGQVTFPGGSKSGCVSVTIVHPDKVPMVPGFGQQPRFIVTIQPSGALFNPPAPITFPNVDGLAPREVTEMYSFDHDINSFVAIGTGTVSDDGQVIRSNPGSGVLKAGWHCGGNPNVAGAAATCGPCAFCDGTNCQIDPAKAGKGCQNPCIIGGTGTCSNGHCTGRLKPKGAACGIGGTCDQNGNCVFSGGGGCPGGCNSGNPCIDDSCGANNQCLAKDNGQCQSACNGQADGSTCTVGNLTGDCEGGICNLCGALGAGASCTCSTGAVGACTSSGQCGGCPSLSLHLNWRNDVDPSQIYIRQGTALYTGPNHMLTASVTPNSGGTFTWTTAVSGIVNVSGSGDQVLLTGESIGSTDVIVSYVDPSGQTVSKSILVNVIYPIILVHGINSSAATWTSLATALTTPPINLSDDGSFGSVPSIFCNGANPDFDFCAIDFSNDHRLSPWYNQSDFVTEGAVLTSIINHLLLVTGANKVTLVGYSMGGLASRAAIQLLGLAPSVDKLITIGTPHQGSWLATLNSDAIAHVSALAPIAQVASKLDPNSPGVKSLAPNSTELFEINTAVMPRAPAMTNVSIVSLNAAAAGAAVGAVDALVTECNVTTPLALWCIALTRNIVSLNAAIPNSDLLVTTDSQNLNNVFPFVGSIVDSSVHLIHTSEPGAVGVLLKYLGF